MKKMKMAMATGACGLSLLTGCTFCALDGNGPMPRSSVASDLPTASASDLAKWKGEVESLPIKSTRAGVWADHGYTANIGNSYNWDVLCGSGTMRTLLTPRDEGKRTVLQAQNRWGFFRPLFWTLDFKDMDAETGACLSREKATTLTLLFVHASALKPATPDKKTPEHLSKQKNLDDVKYDKSSGMCIGAGLLGWGQKNNRAYFQLAWIPIPLWSLN